MKQKRLKELDLNVNFFHHLNTFIYGQILSLSDNFWVLANSFHIFNKCELLEVLEYLSTFLCSIYKNLLGEWKHVTDFQECFGGDRKHFDGLVCVRVIVI